MLAPALRVIDWLPWLLLALLAWFLALVASYCWQRMVKRREQSPGA